MPTSVNEAIDRLDELDGKSVEIFGVISLEFEGLCITHVPKAEQREPRNGGGYYYSSSIWTIHHPEKMGITEEGLKQFDGRQVVVSGKLRKPAPGFGGCGHFSLWPAEIDVSKIRKRENDA